MRVLFIALLMVLATHVTAQERAPNQDVEHAPTQTEPAKETAIQPNGAETRVEPVAPAQPPKEEHDQAIADDTKSTSNNSLFWGDGVAQWVMAITSILALGVSAWAVWLVRRSLVLTREAVEAAVRSADLADKAITVTREVGEAQSRAYINVKEANFDQGQERATLVIQNFGQTSAYDVIVKTTWSVNDGKTTDYPHNFGIIDPDHSHVAIVNFSAQDVSDIARKGNVLNIHCDIAYRDVFKTKWVREVRYVLHPDLSSKNGGSGKMYIAADTGKERKADEGSR